MKLAVVIQRYGAEITGGSESHCMAIVGRLARFAEVEVITTCARDYVTWRNEYPEGMEMVNGIPVHRFQTDRERKPRKFDRFSQQLYTHPHTYFDEVEWMVQQGPYAPGLFQFIKEQAEVYDAFIFYTYIYPTAFFGMQYVPHKSIFVSTAHDEPPIYFDIFRTLFHLPQAFWYLTEEEKALVHRLFHNEQIPYEVLGAGVNSPLHPQPEGFRQQYGIQSDFLLYAGRIDEGKGCGQMLEFFLRYKAAHPGDLTLVLMGKAVMKIPERPDIRMLGFVSEEDKINGMSAATVLLMPSQMESLSIVTLEAWSVETPALVNGNCAVLRGHCLRSNGGLYYTNYEEFEACLNLLLENRSLASALGKNGKDYIQNNYQWDVIDKKLLHIVEGVLNRPSECQSSARYIIYDVLNEQ
ncbi:hexosyltransferase [Candidatus Vecturithrix granuli]|uniref:Hexosyltransferase n=1 Tax=Vecturithrix granuli TaxID=1499967 RepID=A0A081BVA1_VECG1|nr:hexosyltransferase [Candidatus Vecturithrix granuli]